MKIANYSLVLLGWVTTCSAVDDLPQLTRDFISNFNKNAGECTTREDMHAANLGSGGSAVQEQKREIDFLSTLGTHPNPTPSPSSGNWGETHPREVPTEAHSGTKRPFETHLPTPSTKRRKQDEIQNQPQTIDLLRNLEHGPPDPQTFDDILHKAVYDTKSVLNQAQRVLNSRRITELLERAVKYVETLKPRTTPVHVQNGGHFVPPMPGNPASFRQPVFVHGTPHVPDPTSDDMAGRLSNILAVSSHRAQRHSDSASVQVANQRNKRRIIFADTRTEQQRQLPALKTSRTDRTHEGSSLRSNPKNLDDSLANLIFNRLASRQKEIAKEPVENPQLDISLASQPSSSRNDQFTRLEFTHDVLEARRWLSEDQDIIAKIKAFNPNENKLVIYEKDYGGKNGAVEMFLSCYYRTRNGASEFREMMGNKARRTAFYQQHFRKLMEKRLEWITFWNQKTKLNLKTDAPIQTGGQRKKDRLGLVFLFYVEMIDSILPKSQGITSDEHNSNILESAFENFETFLRENGKVENSTTLDSFLQYTILSFN
ncbi:hypothetical protein PtA15_1A750 [Puccinia triticina]|uniref:Uncharacterized protein n=1 Tax=Puccinia triticina TaxID=208348 RepID=A0ABY7C8S8_9BASI|nr:uncharacterized protein PtA15_1A750 [Puccinia triticina]WAQ81409.1 hypothetical protein PtA15_1A750 [Puccinia triticina]